MSPILQTPHSNRWLAAAAFPEAKVNLLISDDGDWKGLTDRVPDMLLCTCCQGECCRAKTLSFFPTTTGHATK